MPWIIGIDEAGYGPNLGPLVMTAVAWRVEHAADDPWQLLADHVRRDGDPNDDRLLIADSKVVYSPADGLTELERGVLALTAFRGPLGDLCGALFPASLEDVCGEFWFAGSTELPCAVELADLLPWHERLAEHAPCLCVHGRIVTARRFNAVLDQHDSKAAVLTGALVDLLRHFLRLGANGDPLSFVVDKHGGRNTYAAMLQHAFADGLVLATEEGRLCSAYEVFGLSGKVRIRFEPRADGSHFCVALASMISKYTREVLMREFNAFWRQRLPELKPTAGYPSDATRFLRDIQPAAISLGLEPDCYWRRR